MPPKLRAGDPMPAFALPDHDGRLVESGEILGRGPIVIFFYPRDDTRGCTAQACGFRDAYEDFAEAGAEVFGISRDGGSRHRDFRGRHDLPFRLLTDEGGEVAERFGVPKTLGLLPGRSTFIFDARGALRHAFHSQFQPTRHVDEARRVVEKLARAAS